MVSTRQMVSDRIPEAEQVTMLQTLQKEMEEMRQKNKEKVALRRRNEEEV